MSNTLFSAVNSNSQRLKTNLDNTTLTAPIVQWIQDISNGTYTSEGVTQRFIFGTFLSNPLELNSISSSGSLSSEIRANNFVAYSDVRLKQNIEPLSETQGVDNIRVVQYNNKSDNSKHFGVIAHELAEIYPELVHSDENNMQSVSYTELIPICINEIQLMTRKIDALQSRLDRIENALLNI
jgi:hypothetical protein